MTERHRAGAVAAPIIWLALIAVLALSATLIGTARHLDRRLDAIDARLDTIEQAIDADGIRLGRLSAGLEAVMAVVAEPPPVPAPVTVPACIPVIAPSATPIVVAPPPKPRPHPMRRRRATPRPPCSQPWATRPWTFDGYAD